jgi:hypothetical protein
VVGFPFATALLACVMTSLAFNANLAFMPQTMGPAVIHRRRLVKIMVLSAFGAPMATLVAGIDLSGLIWMFTGAQAAAALWLGPRRGRPRLSESLVLLMALSAWMSVTVWIGGGPLAWPFFSNALLAAAVTLIAARRTGLIGGFLFGATVGATFVIVHSAFWVPIFATSVLDAIGATIVLGGVLGMAGCVDRRMLGFAPSVEFRTVDLDHKTGAAVRRLRMLLHRGGALIVKELAGGRKAAELNDAKAVPLLIKSLSSRDLSVRYSAAEVLARIGPAAEAAIPALRRLVGFDPQPGERAGEALARIGSAGVEALIELLHSDDAQQRAGAAQSLRLTTSDSMVAAEALVGALDDNDAGVRQHAAASLAELDHPTDAVISALQKALADPSLSTRHAARKSLARLRPAT